MKDLEEFEKYISEVEKTIEEKYSNQTEPLLDSQIDELFNIFNNIEKIITTLNIEENDE